MLQRAAVRCSRKTAVLFVLQYFVVCCRVLHCVAVCCSELEDVHMRKAARGSARAFVDLLQCVVVCCSVLQCVAMCCSVVQCVVGCRSVGQCVAV